MDTNKIVFCPADEKVRSIDIQKQCTQNSPHHRRTNGESNILADTQNPAQTIFKSEYSLQLQRFDDFFKGIVGQLNRFTASQENKNSIYVMFEQLLSQFCQLMITNIESKSNAYCNSACGKHIISSINDVSSYMKDKCSKFNTSYKREKELKQMANYVAPIEKAIGLKWKSVSNAQFNLPDHNIVQQTFHFIPVIDQLNAFFSDPRIAQLYIDYNEHRDHIC